MKFAPVHRSLSNLLALLLLVLVVLPAQAQPDPEMINLVPYLESAPEVDGDLSEWKHKAFNDGAWSLDRVKKTPWYQPKRNRLTVEPDEEGTPVDLNATYYIAWDKKYLYLGAEVLDNINDVTESKHAPKRWYYKDAIAWFIEAPYDGEAETFKAGDHGFAFVIDTTRPDYGAWWRHGTAEQAYLEEPLPTKAVDYVIRMKPHEMGKASYTLEARIQLKSTLKKGDRNWKKPKVGDVYSMMIVHCDPDGGEYGGHLLIYGKGDDDATWRKMILSEARND